MNRADSLHNIQRLMAVFIQEIKNSSAMGHTDINRVSEDILVPLLRIALKYPNLKNLNSEEKENFPGVDLGDYDKGVAIQVTSTSSSEKIRSSLEKFVDHGLDDYFNHVRFYILTEKQRSYQGSDWGNIIGGKFKFSKEKDILDSSDLLKAINSLDAEDIRRIDNFLQDEFDKSAFTSFSTLSTNVGKVPEEEVFSNILEVFFADELYTAKIRTQVSTPQKLKPSRSRIPKPSRKPPQSEFRSVVDMLKQNGDESVRDWNCHAGQLITFHDLNDPDNPLHQVVEVKTIERISPKEFFEIGVDEERAFKFLLERCLSVRLAAKDIVWQAEEKFYIFMPFRGESVRKEGKRTVYSIKKKLDGNGTLCHRHLAFSTRYHRFREQWFVTIEPDWFFSYDGLKKSVYHSELVDGLKGFENNDTVFRHTRCICGVLQSEVAATLFESEIVYPYLWFGSTMSFPNGRILKDDEWNPSEPKKVPAANLSLLDDADTD